MKVIYRTGAIMRRVLVVLMAIAFLGGAVAFANDAYEMPNVITDTYQLDFGPMLEALRGAGARFPAESGVVQRSAADDDVAAGE